VENRGHAAPRLDEIRRAEEARSPLRPFRSIPPGFPGKVQRRVQKRQGPDNNRNDQEA